MTASVEVISHWHHSFEGFNTSALEFYRSVEETLRAKEAPGVTTTRVDWSEAGIFSAKREYLRVSYGRFSFDLCAAPFGKDYFFSWWLVKRGASGTALFGCLGVLAMPLVLIILIKTAGFIIGFLLFIGIVIATGTFVLNSAQSGNPRLEDAILAIPIVGSLYARFVKPVTYYSTDSRLIFEEAVHRVVINHIEALTSIQKLAPLTAAEIKPETRPSLA